MKEKRELILQSVLELFMEEGINGLKVSKIASHAEIGKGTVYEYFNSKEELFLGAVEYGIIQLGEAITKKLKKSNTFQESFFSLVDCIAEITAKGPFLSIMSDSANMPFSKEATVRLKSIMQNAMESFMGIMSEIIAKGVDEGLLKLPADSNYVKAMVIIITNMTLQNIHSGETNFEELRVFYYNACLKLFS